MRYTREEVNLSEVKRVLENQYGANSTTNECLKSIANHDDNCYVCDEVFRQYCTAYFKYVDSNNYPIFIDDINLGCGDKTIKTIK